MNFDEIKEQILKFAGKDAFGADQRSGFRAIQCSRTSSPKLPASELFYELESETNSKRVILMSCYEGALKIEDSSNWDGGECLHVPDVRSALTANPVSTLLFIENFHLLIEQDQQELLASLRGARETNLELRLVVTGQWPFQTFQRNWRNQSNSDTPLGSPPFDAAMFLEGSSRNQLETYLTDVGLDSSSTDDFADHLWHMTRGDRELVNIVTEYYRTGQTEEPERLFDRLDDLPILEDLVHCRCDGLNTRETEILDATLRFQRVRLPYDDADVEDLVLRGLLSSSQGGGIGERTLWEISSPALSFALLRYWNVCGNPIFLHTRELLPPLQNSAGQAYEIICKTENLLRNTLCLTIGREVDQDFHAHLLSLFPSEQRDETAKRIERDKRELDISLRQTLSSYLDLKSLGVALANVHAKEGVRPLIFHDKNILDTKLSEFNRIRIHIAHGRPVSRAVVKELCSINLWFENALAEAASSAINNAELARVPLSILGAKVDCKNKVIRVTIRNDSGKAFPLNAKLRASAPSIKWSGGPVPASLAAGNHSVFAFSWPKDTPCPDVSQISVNLGQG